MCQVVWKRIWEISGRERQIYNQTAGPTNAASWYGFIFCWPAYLWLNSITLWSLTIEMKGRNRISRGNYSISDLGGRTPCSILCAELMWLLKQLHLMFLLNSTAMVNELWWKWRLREEPQWVFLYRSATDSAQLFGKDQMLIF